VSGPDDLDAELAELTRQARAWVEWAYDTGAAGLPSEGDADALLRSLDAPARAPKAGRPMRGAGAPRGVTGQRPATAVERPAQQPAPPAPPAETASAAGGNASAAAPADAGERRRQLKLLADEVATCTRCPLHEARQQTVFERGSPEAELVFVGEGPGAQEDAQGLPFVGPAGQLLDKMIAAMGYQPDDVYICNIVKCRPPRNRKPTEDEIAACTPYLRRQLELVQPRVMVALGATGVQGLLGTTTGITRLRGTWKLYRGRVPLMPTFHPAYLLRSPEKKRDVWSDLKEVMSKLGRTPPAKKQGS
jgi:DNA polymerase